VPRLRLVVAIVTVATVGGAGAGCSRPGGGDAQSTGRVVSIVERDFAIVAPTTLSAGDARFRVRNDGPDDHELIIVRVNGVLPVRHDGITLDEDALEDRTIGILEPVEPGTTHDLHVHLEPGKYELFCNMAGHFRGGMHVTVTVM
jgi:uncharacterized cupredoxin-like copper-binding protein